jgi:hypothetical protein
MLHEIALYLILGKPFFMWMGIITFLSLFFTASIAISTKLRHPILPFKWHPRIAKTTLVLAFIHALLAFSINNNF